MIHLDKGVRIHRIRICTVGQRGSNSPNPYTGGQNSSNSLNPDTLGQNSSNPPNLDTWWPKRFYSSNPDPGGQNGSIHDALNPDP